MSVKKNLLEIKALIPSNVALVAVSKTKPVEDLLEAYEAGQRIFGENKAQEMTEKYEKLPKDIEWHMIGHLQTNKIKLIAPYVSLIHGVDSFKVLQEIDKQAQKHNRVINCLLQIHIAEEETKFGLNQNELEDIVNSAAFKALSNIKVKGLMGMATFTENQPQIKKEFDYILNRFEDLKQMEVTANFHPEILSIGMSGDYKIAIECGSTMVRIGSSIFGTR